MRFKLQKQYRLPGYDYSGNSVYFVTICTKGREEFFGDIKDDIMGLNDLGNLAAQFWQNMPNHFPFAELDEWVIMPNHLHGILIIERGPDNDEPHHNINISGNDYVRNHGRRNMINHVPTIGNKKFSIINNPMQMKMVSLGKIIRWFKGKSCHYIRENINPDFAWQPRFHDRIIRDQKEHDRITEYIIDNPGKWWRDRNKKFDLN